MPDPSSSTGAQPSAEAVAPGLRDDLVGRIYRRLNIGGGLSATSTDCIRAVLYAAEIDAATIREEGRAAGRDEALREVVVWAHANANDMGPVGRLFKPSDWRLLADATEAAFPTTEDAS